MKRPPLTVPVVLVLLAVASGAAFWPQSDLPAPRAVTQVTPETTTTQVSSADDFGGPFSLTDQYGMRRTDMDFRGKYMLIFFGYTYCPDVCPTALAVEADALDKLGERAGRIVPIFITVDPKRDTPDKLKSYLSAFNAAPPSVRPNFVGLTGSDEEIAKVADGYGVYYQAHIDGRVTDGASYSVDHSGHTYLMSPDGKFVAYYTQGILADELATDLMLKISPG